MTDQELSRLFSSLQSSIGSFTNAIDTARRNIDDLSSSNVAEQREFDERLKKLGRWNKAEDAERIAALKQYRQDMKALEDARKKALDDMERHQEGIKTLTSGMSKLQESRDKHLKAAKAGDVEAAKLAKAEQLQINKLMFARADERKKITALTQKMGEATTVQQSIVDKMRKTESELGKFSWGDAGKKVGSKLGDAVTSSIKNVMSGLTVGRAISGMYSGLTEIMATGGDNIYASISKQVDLVKLGLTPEEYIKMNAASRQTILATGGANVQLKILSERSEELRGYFKSVGEATQFTQGQMDLLARSGVRPNIENAVLLNESFKKLQSYTGMTGDAFLAMQHELSADSDIQSQLRSANMAEREQILANNAARMAENVALGMTVDQAKNVTKSLAKMAGTGPLDRIKQAAKMRAFGAAMGIAGSDEAANIHLKGQRATDAEKAQLQDWHSQMSGKASESKTGSLANEILVDRLQAKVGTEFTAADSPFNTRLAEGNAIAKGALDAQVQVPPLLEKLISKTQQGGAALANPAIQAAGGIGNTLWGVGGSAAAGAAGAWGWGKMKGMLPGSAAPTTAPTTTAAPAASGAGAASNAKYLKYGKMAGRVAQPLAVGLAAYEGYDAYNEHAAGRISESERNAKMGSAGGGLAGMWAGAAAGGAIGGAAGLGIGAIPGALVGGTIGYLGGSALGEKAGGAIGSNQLPPMADKTTPAVPTMPQPVQPVLTSAETRADTTSPIGLQLSKMDDSNVYLKDLTMMATKQIELAEKQLAATLVSASDRAEVYKSLAAGNKFMTSYSTLT